MLESLTQKQKFIFFIILLFMISIIIYYMYSSLYPNNFSLYKSEENIIYNDFVQTNTNIENTHEHSTIENLEINSIIIYICGAVKESKVICLNENSRICDAIDAVGGLNANADITNINLAQILEDGDKIYIPKKGEEIPSDSITSSSNNSYTSSSISNVKNNKININKATQTELETIPGIGPSTALKIINYRNENGKFKSIQDIKNISGIGDAKYEKIKNYISI